MGEKKKRGVVVAGSSVGSVDSVAITGEWKGRDCLPQNPWMKLAKKEAAHGATPVVRTENAN